MLQPFVLIALLMVSALHALFGVNRETVHLVLATVRVVLTGAYISCSQPTSTRPPSPSSGATRATREHITLTLTVAQQSILDSVPRVVRTALAHLKIEADFVRYASCPICPHTYSPDVLRPNDLIPGYVHLSNPTSRHVIRLSDVS